MDSKMKTRKDFLRSAASFVAASTVVGCEKVTAGDMDVTGQGEMKTYKPRGTCSRAINYAVRDGIVTACEIVGGCPGNARGIAKLILGRKATDVIATLKGIPCRNGTSCPDQLARALEAEISAGRGAP